MIVCLEVWEPFFPLPASEWNLRNLENINVADPKNFSFAVFGENLNSKIVFENILKVIDHDSEIAFAVSLGDMVSRGRKLKYHFLMKQVRDNLGIPLLTTMGSHELKAKGRRLYQDVFGPAYYSFNIGNNFFLIVNNVGKEGRDLIEENGWIENKLINSHQYEKRFLFMNMPIHDPRGKKYRGLQEKSSEKIAKLFLKYPLTHIFAAHIHGYFKGLWNGTPYHITGGAGAKFNETDPNHYFFHFLKVTVKDGQVDVLVKPVPNPDRVWMDRLSYYLNYLSQYMGIHFIEMILIFGTGIFAAGIYRSGSSGDKRDKI